MAHASGNPTWTNTSATPIDVTPLENIENRVDTTASLADGSWGPSDQNMITWTFDSVLCGSTGYGPPASGTLTWGMVKLPSAQTCTGIVVGIQTAGSGLTAGQNLAGVYSSAGTLLRSTTDCSTLWNSAAAKSCPFTSTISLGPGSFFIVLMANGTTNPVFSANSLTSAPIQYGRTISQIRSGGVTGARSTLPGTLPTATIVPNAVWLGLY